MNWIEGNKEKISNLEFALDYLCRATKRDIFIIPPEKEKDHIEYLKKEIEKNIEDVKELGGVVQAFVVASRHVITIDHRSKVYPRVVIY